MKDQFGRSAPPHFPPQQADIVERLVQGAPFIFHKLGRQARDAPVVEGDQDEVGGVNVGRLVDGLLNDLIELPFPHANPQPVA